MRGLILEKANFDNCWFDRQAFRDCFVAEAVMPNHTSKLPKIGKSFIGWKKVEDGVILKLQILTDSPRVAIFGQNQFRTKSVRVLNAYEQSGTAITNIGVFSSQYDKGFCYTVGEIVTSRDYDPDPLNDYSYGIHFFLTFEEAKSY
jgi:hypothetical protein